MPDDMARWLRILSWFPFGMAALTAGVLALIIVTGEGDYDNGAFAIPIVLAAIGFAMRYFASQKKGRRSKGITLEFHGSWAFKLFGLAIMAMGVITAFDDPAGFFAIPFGAVFFGAGHLLKVMTTTPEGKKQVWIPPYGIAPRKQGIGDDHPETGTFIYVDQGADSTQAVEEWRQEQFARRADWVAGRIVEQGVRDSGKYKWMMILHGTVVAILALVAWLTGEEIFWIAVAGGLLFLAVVVFLAVKAGMHARKFDASHFVPKSLPATLGGRIEGRVETSLTPERNPRTGFTLGLECTHRWTEGVGEDEESYSEAVWKDTRHARGEEDPETGHISVPLFFDLPADAQPTSLGSVSSGYHWSVSAKAEDDGLDYAVEFEFPVQARDDPR